MKLTINNTFHSTTVNLIINRPTMSISSHQVKRAERELCGLHGCACGKIWGTRHVTIEGYEECHFEPAMDSRTGAVTGADLVEN